jgi:hypothetical protein
MKRIILWTSATAVLLCIVFFARLSQLPLDSDGPETGTGSPPPIEPSPNPSVEPTVPPREPPRPAPPTPAPPHPGPPDFSAIDRALEALHLGGIAFNVSTVMTLNRSDNVRLLLSPSTSVEELQKQLLERLARETHVEVSQIRIAPYMEARLSGTNFSIVGLTPELQPVTWKEPTEWRWEVKPAETGSQAFHLTLTAILQIEGKDSARAIRTFDRNIQVQVTWPQRMSGFAAENWQWLWTTVAVPIAVWVWSRKKKKQRGIGF